MSSLTNLPYLPVLKIITPDASEYDWNHFTGTKDFKIDQLHFTPRCYNVGGEFEMRIYSDTPNFVDNIPRGSEVLFYAGKTDNTKIGLMRGIVTKPAVVTEAQDLAYIRLKGYDWWSWVAQRRIIKYYWLQDIDSDGNPDESDDSTVISDVVKQILGNESRVYPTQSPKLTDMGLIIDDALIQIPAGAKIPLLQANFESVEDKMKTLAEAAGGANFGTNIDKKFFMNIPRAQPSGILFSDSPSTDTVWQNWPEDKRGYITDLTPQEIEWDGEDYRRRIFGLGAGKRTLESSQETVTHSESLESNYLAQRITIKDIHSDLIQVWLSKTGTPPLDLTIELVEDDGGEPGTSQVRFATIAEDAITTGGKWHNFDLQGEELNSSKNYWIIIRPVGDGSNHYNWHHDNGNSGVNASSSDGSTWSVNSSSHTFAYRYFYHRELYDILEDDQQRVALFNEDVFRRSDITNDWQMGEYLMMVAQQVFYPATIYKATMYAANTLPLAGQKVRIRVQQNPQYNFDRNDFVLVKISYDWVSSKDQQRGLFTFPITATRLEVNG